MHVQGTENAPKRGLRWDLVVPIALAVGVFVCFSPALRGELLTWDDQANLVENTAWRGFSGANLRWMWTTFYMGHYQPLTWMSFALQHALGADSPAAMHTLNVLLHALNAVLFFLLGRALLRAGFAGTDDRTVTLAAGFAAALFALHPLRAESVAWITERRDVLSTALLLGAALAYLRSVEVGRAELKSKAWYAACVGLAALSCLSKAWGMTFFLVVLALDAWPLRRLGQRALIEKWPLVLIGAGTAWLASRAQEGTFAVKTLEQWPLTDRLVQACYGLWFYVRETAAPSGLSPLYQLPARMAPGEHLFSIAFAAALLGLVVWCRRRRPAVAVALAVYIVLLTPVLGFFQAGEQLVADRYSYLATMPLALLAGAGAVALVRRAGATGSKLGAPLAALGGVVVASLALLTYAQAAVWRTTLSLWEQGAAATPTPIVLVYYGDALRQDGRADDAYAAYAQALSTDPKNGRAQFSCGQVLEQQGRIAEAERAYLDAIPNLNTARYRAHERLGVIYWNKGRRDEALAQFELAMAEVQRPDHKKPSGEPFIMMARARHEMGDKAGTDAMLRKAAEYPDTREMAASLLVELGRD